MDCGSGAAMTGYFVMPGLTRHPFLAASMVHGKPAGLSGRHSEEAV